MTLRYAEKKDVEKIVLLCKEHMAFEKVDVIIPDAYSDMLSRHLFNSDNAVKCILVEYKNEVLGYATFIKQFATWKANYYIYLDCLFLKENARGKGVGKQIMLKIKAFAKSQNCSEIQWQTPEFNTDAIRFYQKLGAISKTKERFSWNI